MSLVYFDLPTFAGPPGVSLRCRLYHPDGVTTWDFVCVEDSDNPGDYSVAPTIIFPSPIDSQFVFKYGVREVTAQTNGAYNAATGNSIIIGQSNYAFLQNGLWTGGGGAGGTVVETGGEAFTVGGGTVVPLSVAQGTTTDIPFLVVDENNAPVNLGTNEVRFVVFDFDKVVLFSLSNTGGSPTVAVGDGNGTLDKVVVSVGTTQTAVPYAGRYALWDYTSRDIIAQGPFTIKTAPLA